MFFVRRPDDDAVRSLLRARKDADWTHPHPGRTREPLSQAPSGHALDRYDCVVGQGEVGLARAIDGLSDWRHYATPFTRVVPLETGLREGLLFATVAAHFGFFSVQPCRVVYVEDARSEGRFAFGIGTLPGHDGSGEERFELDLDPRSGQVRYAVQAFSRPATPLARLGRPLMRVVQRRFQRETRAALRAHCEGSGTGVE